MRVSYWGCNRRPLAHHSLVGFFIPITSETQRLVTTIKERLDSSRDDIESRYAGGESIESIGRVYGCCAANVWTALDRWGVEIRRRNYGEQYRDDILDAHAFGRSANQIAKDLGVSRGVVVRVLNKAGIDVSHRTYKCKTGPIAPRLDAMIARYNEGYGLEAIGKEFGCTASNIKKHFRRAGVRIKSVRDYSYPVDEHFFDVIDTEEKAYTLGFLMADGCNSPHIPVLRLAITDRDVLEMMAAAMGFGGPIKTKQREDHKPIHVMNIGSRVMCDALVRAGCGYRKTYHATYPDRAVVPEHLERHLIRGWNDGDGTITRNTSRGSWSSRIVGTHAVCLGLQDAVRRHLGFDGQVYPVHDSGKHVTHAFDAGKPANLRRYLDWLYADATIYLPRKRDKYLEFLAALPVSGPAGPPG